MELVTATIRPLRLEEVRNARGLVGFRRERYSEFGSQARALGLSREITLASASREGRLFRHQKRRGVISRRSVSAQQSTLTTTSVVLQSLNGSI